MLFSKISCGNNPASSASYTEWESMNLKIILFVLALLAFSSASIGGFLYYSSLRESALKEAERQAVAHADMIKKIFPPFFRRVFGLLKPLPECTL